MKRGSHGSPLKLAPFNVDRQCHYASAGWPGNGKAFCGAKVNYYDVLETHARIQTVTCVRCRRKAEKEEAA